MKPNRNRRKGRPPKFVLDPNDRHTINAARKLGIPELARMTDLPPLEPPLSLDKVLQYYIKRRKPSPEEVKKMKAAWKGFRSIIPVNTVREISSDMIHDYKDTIRDEFERDGWKASRLKARFSRVKTLFKYSFENGRTNSGQNLHDTALPWV